MKPVLSICCLSVLVAGGSSNLCCGQQSPTAAGTAEEKILGRPISRWLSSLRSDDPSVAESAARRLASEGARTQLAAIGLKPEVRALVQALAGNLVDSQDDKVPRGRARRAA